MAHVYSAELHRTWGLSPNEAYFRRCGNSGFIPRLNAHKFGPFLRKLQCLVLPMEPSIFLTFALKTLYTLVLLSSAALHTPPLYPVPHAGLFPTTCLCSCQPGSCWQPLPVWMVPPAVPAVSPSKPTFPCPGQAPSPPSLTPAHPHPYQLLRSPQYRLSLGEVQSGKRGGDKEQVVRTKGAEARGQGHTDKTERGPATVLHAGWKDRH